MTNDIGPKDLLGYVVPEYLRTILVPNRYQEIGRRDEQQDSFAIKGNVYVLSDGMGGVGNGGAWASTAVCRSLEEINDRSFPSETTVCDWIGEVSEFINESWDSAKGKTPGATVLIAQGYSRQEINNYRVFNVGDSAAFLVDVSTNTMREITIRDNPPGYANELNQHLGGDFELESNMVHTTNVFLAPHQFLILATDGLHELFGNNPNENDFLYGAITKKDVIKILKHHPNDAAKKMIDLAEPRLHDNASCIVIPYVKPR